MRTFRIPASWGEPAALQAALDTVQPGDQVVLERGEHRFDRPARLRRGGTASRPIKISGEPGTIVRGHAGPVPLLAWHMANADDWAFLQILEADHVEVEDLYFADCWPVAVYAERSCRLAFRNCRGIGGSFLFVVRDRAPWRRVEGVEVSGCSWSQDPRIWASLPWKQVHDDGREKDGSSNNFLKGGLYNFLNGGLLGTADIVGDVRFVRNAVSDCYNGLVADISPAFREQGEDLRQTNRNFEIADNVFERVRDNPIEPEWHAFNWHIRENRFIDCHSWFSFDNLSGGWWYVYANRGWFRSRPGGAIADGHSVGEVFKMTNVIEPEEFGRVYVFNNSFHLRAPLFGNANDDQENPADRTYTFLRWLVADNAFSWCAAPDGGPRPLCEPCIPPFEPGGRAQDTAFARTLTNSPRWPEQLLALGLREASPRPVAGAVFAGGDGAFDFTLTAEAARLGEAVPFDMLYPDGTRATLGAPRRIGACQAKGFVWPSYRTF